MILLDFSSIMISVVMVRMDDFIERPDILRHQVLNSIRMYNTKFKEEYGEMVLCFDSTGNWRKKIYPHYKANRRKGRDDSSHDWDMIFNEIGKIKEELKKYSPYKILEIHGAEADDIIGAVCELNTSPKPILIVSPDRDFVQLQKYPNVKQFSNLQKKWVEPEVDPITDLQVKILKGDKGDGVPNVLSSDESLINNERQGVMSKKKLQMLKEDPESLGVEVARNVIRNRNMIDLTRTPVEIKEEAIRQLNENKTGSITSLMTYMTKHQMKLLIECLPEFEVNK